MLKVKFDSINHSAAIKENERKWLDAHIGEWLPIASISFDDQAAVPYVIAIRSDTEQLVACVFLDYPNTIYTVTHNDCVLYTNKKED